MWLIIVLSVFALSFGIVAFYLTKGLNDGKKKIKDGRCKLAKHDNWFFRIVAKKRLDEGRRELFDGEKRYVLYWKIRLVCILVWVVCVIGAVVIFFDLIEKK